MSKKKPVASVGKPYTRSKPVPNNYMASEYVQATPDLAMLNQLMIPLPVVMGNEPANVAFAPPVNQPVFSPPSTPYTTDVPLQKPTDLTLTVDAPVTTGGIQSLGPIQPTTMTDVIKPAAVSPHKNMWLWILIIAIAAIAIYTVMKTKK